MSNTLTGDHDLVLEISEAALAAFARGTLGGVQTFNSLLGNGTLAIADVSVRLLARATPWVELTARIADGGLDFTTPIERVPTQLRLRELRGTLVMAVPIEVAARSGAAVLAIDFQRVEFPATAVTLDPGVRDAFLAQLAAQGVPQNHQNAILMQVFDFAIPSGIRSQGVRDLPLTGYGLDPTADRGFAVDTAGRRVFAVLQLAIRAASGGTPAVLVAAGTFQQAHLAAAAVAAKSRVALDAAHAMSLTLDPEAFRDGIVCPALAAQLGTTPNGLCPACGTGGAFSLKGVITSGHIPTVNLTSVSVTFTDGAIVLGARVTGDITSGSAGGGAKGGFTLDMAASLMLSVVAGRLVPQIVMSRPSIEIDIFILGDLLEDLAEAALQSVGQQFAQVFADSAAKTADLVLPTEIAGVAVTIDSVVIHPEGITLQATMPQPKSSTRRPSLRIDQTQTESVVRVGAGTATHATCAKSSYTYVDYAAKLAVTLQPVARDLAPTVRYRWFINNTQIGPGMATGGFAATIEIANGVYDDATVSVTTSLTPDGKTLVLTNDPNDGSYVLLVRLEADDQLDRYEAIASISMDGARRVWDPRYFRDLMQCVASSVKDDRIRIPSPRSDEPGWGWSPRDLLSNWIKTGHGGDYRTVLGDLRITTALLEVSPDITGFLGADFARAGDVRVGFERWRRALLAKHRPARPA